jgi:hypothetical protein
MANPQAHFKKLASKCDIKSRNQNLSAVDRIQKEAGI